MRPHANGQQIVDAGLLAATLLFYDNIHIVANRSLLNELAKNIGQENLIRVLKDKYIKLTYVPQHSGTMTNTQNGVRIHNFASFWLGAKPRRRMAVQEDVTDLMESLREIASDH